MWGVVRWSNNELGQMIHGEVWVASSATHSVLFVWLIQPAHSGLDDWVSLRGDDMPNPIVFNVTKCSKSAVTKQVPMSD